LRPKRPLLLRVYGKSQGAKGRDVVEFGQGYQLREAAADYKPLFRDENDDIGLENAYFWNLNAE
jgi:hypothetical protein